MGWKKQVLPPLDCCRSLHQTVDMKSILCVLILLLVPRVLPAQVVIGDLNACIELVNKNNPALQSENFYYERSVERLKSARSVLFPQVRAFGTFDDNISLPVQLIPAQFIGGPEGSYEKVQFGTQFNSTFGVEATLSIFNPSAWMGITSSQHARTVTKYSLEEKRLGLHEQTTQAYFGTILSRESMVLDNELVQASDSLLDAATVRLKNGMIEQLDYNRVKAINLRSLQQLELSRAAYSIHSGVLKTLIGAKPSDSLVFTQSALNSLNAEQMAATISYEVAGLPGYRMIHARIAEMEAEQKRAKLKTLPEINLFARYSRQSFSNDFSSLPDQSWFEVGVVGVRADWNLFSGFNREANVRMSSLQVNALRKEEEAWTNQAQHELASLDTNVRTARLGAIRFNEQWILAMENYRIATMKYNEGIYSIDQLIVVYQELVDTQHLYFRNLSDFLIYQSIINTRNSYH
jgi:outer membrane protein TolC